MDGLEFKDVRRRMVDSQLRTNSVTDARVLWAMAEVPRERFVEPRQAASCYRDTVVPLGGGRALNPAIATGRLLDAARVATGERVLLVGAATGYVAALLATMGALVTALESDDALAARSRAALDGVAGVDLVEGPLAGGWAGGAPYDLIYLDGAAERVPQPFAGLLKQDGRLVGAVIDRGVSRLVVGRRAAGALGLVPFAEFEMATLPGFAPEPAFSF
ncbi:protein-L-isoaspartate O-methyltransferase family protein [Sphingomonas sp.]|uniref:protein-L-isoaspartate O-methyltransferase family protein n=1 Tax=Sphingomonas sp. TaxID=28214 RepID=UPI003B006863